MRYIVMLDPADQWLVYDTVADLPAEVAGACSSGCRRQRRTVWPPL